MKKSLIALIAGFVLCTAIRLYTIVACTDMTSGFYYHDSELLSNILYYGAIALTFVGAVIAARFDEKGEFGRVTEKDVTDARAAVVGFGLLILALFAGYEGMAEAKSRTPLSMLILADYAFAAGAVILAFIVLYKKEFKPFMGFIMALGGAYYTARGICCFKERMVIASVPEYVIAALSAVGASVTFLMFARFFSGNSGKLTKKAMCGWSAATAVMILSSAAATALAHLAAPEEISRRITLSKYEAEMFFQAVIGEDGYKMAYTPLVDIVSAVFIAAVLITVLYAKHTEAAADTVTADSGEAAAETEEG